MRHPLLAMPPACHQGDMTEVGLHGTGDPFPDVTLISNFSRANVNDFFIIGEEAIIGITGEGVRRMLPRG